MTSCPLSNMHTPQRVTLSRLREMVARAVLGVSAIMEWKLLADSDDGQAVRRRRSDRRSAWISRMLKNVSSTPGMKKPKSRTRLSGLYLDPATSNLVLSQAWFYPRIRGQDSRDRPTGTNPGYTLGL